MLPSPMNSLVRNLWLVALGASVLGSLIAGCGNKGDERAAAPLGDGNVGGFGGGHPVGPVGACNGDETLQEHCSVYITQASGVTSCFSGFKFCDDGIWSECLDRDRDPRIE